MKKLILKTTFFFLVYLCFGHIHTYSQTFISGKVTGPDGAPAIGVSVVIKGTTTGTITDSEGFFKLNTTQNTVTLVFSYVGFIPVTLQATSETFVELQMEEEFTELNEIVVIGYGSQKKSDLTGSIATVSASDMKSGSILSADQALQGKASGVLVANNGGAPGSSVSVKIRGVGTFGNADPLYVVDGMPIKDGSFGKEDNPMGINYLNPNDIESIQILKDASAAAIYGTRGANGVVLITTKRGTTDGVKINIDNYVGQQTLPRRIDVLDAQQFATLWNQVKTDNLFDADEIAGLNTTNWIDEITQKALVYNNQVSISGGKNDNSYYLSVNNFNQDGIVQRSGFSRQSVRINSDNQINKWLKVGESFTLMQSNRDRQTEGNGGVIYQALRSDPTMPVYDNTGNWSYLARSGSNPKGVVDRNNYSYSTTRFQGSLYAEAEIFKNLKYKFNGGIDRSWGKRLDFKPEFFIAGPESNEFNTLTTENESWNNWLIENTLTYNISRNKHQLNLLVGYTSQFEIKEFNLSTVHLPSSEPDMWYPSAKESLADVTDLGGGAREWALISQLGRVNYSFDSKYLFTGSIRRDGSSRFGTNKKYGIFPSASIAWKLSEEEFFKNINLLQSVSLMKLRLGWGKVGNQNIIAYAYNGSVSNRPDQGRSSLETVMGIPKTSVPYYVDYALKNPDIGWETNITTNAGLDMTLWRGKFVMSLDAYKKTTLDLLMVKQLPNYFGKIDNSFGKIYTNLGEVSNKGIEFTATYKKFEGVFNFDVTGNFSRNINNVVSLEGGQPPVIGNSIVIKEGVPLGTFYGYKTEGIFRDPLDIVNHAYQAANTAPGDIKYKDLNKDGRIDARDQTYIGNAFPDFIYGLTTNVYYKAFDLNVFMIGVYGNEIYNYLKQNALYDPGFSGNISPEMLNSWGLENPEGSIITDTNIPRLGKNLQNRYFSDYSLEDGSYFRIKTVTVGYSINNTLIQKAKISNLRVYFTAQNLYTFSKYSGYDPEIGQSTGWNASPLDFGVDAGVYPQPRMYLVGLNLSF